MILKQRTVSTKQAPRVQYGVDYGGLPSIGHHNFIVDGKRNEVADERVLYVHNVVGAHTANPMSGEFLC